MNSERMQLFSGLKRCAVIGQPIAHSLSPRLHMAFARQFSLALDYQRLERSPEQFSASVHDFFTQGGCGLNATLPHKAASFALAKSHGVDAQMAQAANTLSIRAGALHADNTDGLGLCADLARLQINLEGAHVLLLGAGGASAGILPALLRLPVQKIIIQNRDPARAWALCQRAQDARIVVAEAGDDEITTDKFELLISALADGFDEQMPRFAHTSIDRVYDLNYGDRAQASRQFAAERGCAYHDGLGMLIEQAAASFQIWHGLQPDTQALHAGVY